MAIEAISAPAAERTSDDYAAIDLWSLLALTVVPGARVLAIRSANGAALDAALAERGCVASYAPTVAAALEAFGAEPGFAAVVVGDGFEQMTDPIAALRDAVELLEVDGSLVLAAQNAANARARIRAFLGESARDTETLPPRRYDLAAIERVLEAAGLVVTDHLRVFDDAEAADLSAITSLPPELAVLADGPDGRTSAFVLVTRRATAGAVPTSQTLAEALQQQLDAAARRVMRADADRAALEASRTELVDQLNAVQVTLSGARAELEDQRNELESRADALLERIELVERLHADRRHLELDLAVKDDYITDLREELQTWKDLHGALQGRIDTLLRSRHYRVAALGHRALRQIPFVHRLVQAFTNRAMRLGKHVRPTDPHYRA